MCIRALAERFSGSTIQRCTSCVVGLSQSGGASECLGQVSLRPSHGSHWGAIREPPQADHASRSLATSSLAPATKPETRTAGASGLASHALSSWLLLAFQVARLSRAGILRSFLRLGLSDLRPSGQVMSGQGRILLGRNRGPTRSHNPGVQPAPARPLSQSSAQPAVRAGQVRPSHATQCLHVGPSVNGTLSGCPRLWPVPSARPALGRARDPAWAQPGPPLRLRAPCGSNCQRTP